MTRTGRDRFFGEMMQKGVGFSHHVLLRLAVTCVLFLLIVPDASAARRRVIFQLANLHQWAELKYTYDGSGSSGENDRNSQKHNLEEKYHFDIDYAIMGKRLANGGLDLEIGFNQSYKDEGGRVDRHDSSEGFNVEYLVDMLLFERASTPIALYTSRNQEKVNEPFVESHDVVSQHHSANLSIKNKYLPTHLNYHFSESSTDGLDLNRSQESEEVRLSSYLNFGDVAVTDFHAESGYRTSKIEGPAQDTKTDSYLLEVNNIITLNALSQRQVLRSSFRRNVETGTSELESDQWDERLRLRFGQALEAELSHQYRNVETAEQFRREQESKFWVEHRLFRSLTSRYQHRLSEIDFNTGTEESWQRQVSFAYSKRLPADSSLRVAYSYSYGETDRDLDSNTLYIGPMNPENHQLDVFFEVTLDNPDVVVDSIVVRDDFGIIPQNQYAVEPFGRLTRIDFNGNMVGLGPGDDVWVEYAYEVNNSIEYATTTHAVSASVGLFNHKYRFYADASQSDQDLLAGEANVSSLIRQDYLRVGFESQLVELTYGGNYSYLNSTFSTEKYAEAFLNFRRDRKGRVFSVRLTDRFSTIEQNEGSATGGSEAVEKNSLMLHMNYRRQLASRTSLTLKMFLADIRGDNIKKDEATFGLLVESRWYKFLLRITADVTLEYNDDLFGHEEQLSIALRRYF